MEYYLELIPLMISLLTLAVLILLTVMIRGGLNKNQLSNFEDLYKKIKDDIYFSVQPMSDVPVGVEEITELAIEIWRMEQRITKAESSLSDVHKKALENSISRLKKYLQKFDVEIRDYAGQKYNDGLNFDILSREQDSSLESPIIKETVEPTIICRGKVVKRAKVILASNQI